MKLELSSLTNLIKLSQQKNLFVSSIFSVCLITALLSRVLTMYSIARHLFYIKLGDDILMKLWNKQGSESRLGYFLVGTYYYYLSVHISMFP